MEKKTTRILALFIVTVMCLGLIAACSPAGPAAPDTPAGSTEPAAPGTPTAPAPDPTAPPPEGAQFADFLDIIVDNNPIAVVNPLSPAGSPSSTIWVYNLIYDRLVRFLGEGQYGPMLAERWETADSQTFIFHLRDDVYFHNGDHFTAEDVAFTVQIAQAHPGTIAFDRWRDVQNVNVLDSHTVEITLNSANVDFLFEMAAASAGILNERAMTENAETGSWIGTGPYTVSSFSTNDYVALTRNDAYWDGPAITRDLVLRFVPEVSTRFTMLQNEESHVCFSISFVDLPILEADTENFVVYRWSPVVMNYLGFNQSDELASCLYFRRAVASAIDREEIAAVARGDFAIPETTGTLWGLTEFRNNDIPIVPFDLDAARAYLERSVWNGETVELATAIATNVTAAEVVQAQLQQIGLNIEINAMDPAGLASYVTFDNNQSQMIIWVGAVTPNAGSVAQVFLPFGGQNRISYNNPEIAQMIEDARSIDDLNARRAHYLRMQEIMAEDPPGFNLFFLVNAAACVRGVAGIDFMFGDFACMRNIHRVLD
ncbi:MAG: ABC transporter substrate-binding protein [Oscillospiraceae bacterium]|nr:ABC transporter substrate-binding protein [Oscillospiraceae bacterium]